MAKFEKTEVTDGEKTGRALIDLPAYDLKSGDYGILPIATAEALAAIGAFDTKAERPSVAEKATVAAEKPAKPKSKKQPAAESPVVSEAPAAESIEETAGPAVQGDSPQE